MDEELLEKAQDYARMRGGTIGELLGFGIHGIVVVLKSEHEGAARALKIHAAREPYRRERECYERLGECGVSEVSGFYVPHLLRADDAFCALEMTIVSPPFLLDFAGAWLDFPPEFSDDIWAERTAKWAEEFGADWPSAQAVLAELEDLGIYMFDPSPKNICYR